MNLRPFRIFATGAASMLLSVGVAQQTVTIESSGIRDVMLYRNLKPGMEYTPNTNYAGHPRLAAVAWSASGYNSTMRSLISFNLSAIPSGSVIQTATLYFYSDPSITGSGDANGNSQLSGSNAFYLEKVTSSWDEFTVTWNTQPATTSVDRIWIGPSVSTTENRQINLTTMVQAWVNNPASNHGLKMTLENEVRYRSRNYASKNHTNSALRPKLVINYTAGDPLKQRMDHIFGALDQTFINTGILTDYGMDLANHTLFDGTIRTNNEMDMNTWRALYGSLLSSVINPSSNMIHLKTINERMRTYHASYDRNDPSVDVPTLFISYQTLREDAVSQNLIYIDNERLKDVAGRPQSPYITSHAFAAAPSIGFDEDGQVTFYWRTSLFVNSSPKTISSFQADFDDGTGYRTVSSDVANYVTYSTNGRKNLKFRITFTDGSAYNSHASFTVLSVTSSRSSGQARYNGTGAQAFIFPRDEDMFCREVFADPEGGFGATVTVEYGNIPGRLPLGCNPQFIRPFIVVEGYDPSQFEALGIPNRDFFSFIDGTIHGGINVDSDPVLIGDQILGDRLEADGFDLVYVDFNVGTGDVVRNAFLVENIIRWVNAHKIPNPHTGIRERNVVLGQSMGGLVSRYAVCDLERRWASDPATNPDHEVRLLVTQDAPHRGANVPLGFQAMVNDLAPYRLNQIGLQTYGVTGAIIGSFLELRDLVPALDQADQLLDEDATEQLLIVQDGKTNTFLNGNYRAMITFTAGYTPSFVMRAISNGSECGIGQLLQPGSELLYADANFYVNRLAYVVASTLIVATTSVLTGGLASVIVAPLLVLIPFTGKNWKAKFIVMGAPSAGTNQAFYGNLSFKKTVLLVIPINVTLFSSTRNSVAGALPWDSAPGGYYELRDLNPIIAERHINAWPIIDVNLIVRLAQLFSFVPTVSALDITTNPVTQQALNSPYTGGNNPTFPSRFTNFLTQESDPGEVIGSINNSRHIQFTPRNGQWLLDIMNGGNPVRNCSYFCTGTATSPLITGPAAVCNNATFTLNNPSGATGFDWAESANLTPTSPDGGATYTVTRNANGQGFVQVILTGDCGNADPVRRDVTVGGEAANFSISSYPSCGGPGDYFDFVAEITGVNYNWTVNGGTLLSGQGTQFAWVQMNSSSMAVHCYVTGTDPATCFSPEGISSVYINQCFGFSTVSASPNPASDAINIEISEQIEETEPVEVEFRNDFGFLIKTEIAYGNKFVIATGDISDGLYLLRIKYRDRISNHKLLIEK